MSINKQLKWRVISGKNDMLLTCWLILFSLAKSSFFMRYSQSLLNITEPYLKHLPTWLVGVALFAAAILLAIGVFMDIQKLRLFGIFFLGGSWGALAFLSFTHHIGTGHPNSSWISYIFAVLITLGVAHRGVYAE